MLQYFDELINSIEKLGLDNDDVMIIGSGTLTLIGSRMNNDIEFCVNKKSYHKLKPSIRLKLLFWDHVDISENIDLFRNRYLCVGIKDYELFEKKYYLEYCGTKIVIPEIEYAYKLKKKRKKDLMDFERIKTNKRVMETLKWGTIDEITNRRIKTVYIKYNQFRDVAWWLPRSIKNKVKNLLGKK